MAAPGGICISEYAYDAIRIHPEIEVIPLGERRFKNVNRPIRVYAISSGGLPHPDPKVGVPKETARRTLGLKYIVIGAVSALVVAAAVLGLLLFRDGERQKALLVLPLENFSENVEQAYFADGMTEALTADLAQISALWVSSRTTAMQYRGKERAIPEIARELDVDYVAEGSVLLVEKSVSVTAQLIETRTDRHLWAASYDRPLEEILTLQADVVKAVAGEIRVALTPEEEVKFADTQLIDPAAYDALLKASFFLELGLDTVHGAGLIYLYARRYNDPIPLFLKVAEMDPELDQVYYHLAQAHLQQGRIDDAVRKCEKALAIFRSPAALATLAQALASGGRMDRARDVITELSSIQPPPHYELATLTSALEKKTQPSHISVKHTPGRRGESQGNRA